MAKTLTRNATSGGLGVDVGAAKQLLTDMLLIRRFEEKAAEGYALGKIGGFLHLYIGEEAVAVGTTSMLRADDFAISAYREHGHCLAKGSDPKRVMAELYGRCDGLSKGKGGSMHLFDRSTNFLGGHAIGRARGRHGRPRDPRGARPRGHEGAAAEDPVPHRGGHLPVPWPLHARPGGRGLPDQGGSRAREAPGSDRAVPRQGHRRRPPLGGRRAGDRARRQRPDRRRGGGGRR